MFRFFSRRGSTGSGDGGDEKKNPKGDPRKKLNEKEADKEKADKEEKKNPKGDPRKKPNEKEADKKKADKEEKTNPKGGPRKKPNEKEADKKKAGKEKVKKAEQSTKEKPQTSVDEVDSGVVDEPSEKVGSLVQRFEKLSKTPEAVKKPSTPNERRGKAEARQTVEKPSAENLLQEIGETTDKSPKPREKATEKLIEKDPKSNGEQDAAEEFSDIPPEGFIEDDWEVVDKSVERLQKENESELSLLEKFLEHPDKVDLKVDLKKEDERREKQKEEQVKKRKEDIKRMFTAPREGQEAAKEAPEIHVHVSAARPSAKLRADMAKAKQVGLWDSFEECFALHEKLGQAAIGQMSKEEFEQYNKERTAKYFDKCQEESEMAAERRPDTPGGNSLGLPSRESLDEAKNSIELSDFPVQQNEEKKAKEEDHKNTKGEEKERAAKEKRETDGEREYAADKDKKSEVKKTTEEDSAYAEGKEKKETAKEKRETNGNKIEDESTAGEDKNNEEKKVTEEGSKKDEKQEESETNGEKEDGNTAEKDNSQEKSEKATEEDHKKAAGKETEGATQEEIETDGKKDENENVVKTETAAEEQNKDEDEKEDTSDTVKEESKLGESKSGFEEEKHENVGEVEESKDKREESMTTTDQEQKDALKERGNEEENKTIHKEEESEALEQESQKNAERDKEGTEEGSPETLEKENEKKADEEGKATEGKKPKEPESEKDAEDTNTTTTSTENDNTSEETSKATVNEDKKVTEGTAAAGMEGKRTVDERKPGKSDESDDEDSDEGKKRRRRRDKESESDSEEEKKRAARKKRRVQPSRMDNENKSDSEDEGTQEARKKERNLPKRTSLEDILNATDSPYNSEEEKREFMEDISRRHPTASDAYKEEEWKKKQKMNAHYDKVREMHKEKAAAKARSSAGSSTGIEATVKNLETNHNETTDGAAASADVMSTDRVENSGNHTEKSPEDDDEVLEGAVGGVDPSQANGNRTPTNDEITAAYRKNGSGKAVHFSGSEPEVHIVPAIGDELPEFKLPDLPEPEDPGTLKVSYSQSIGQSVVPKWYNQFEGVTPHLLTRLDFFRKEDLGDDKSSKGVPRKKGDPPTPRPKRHRSILKLSPSSESKDEKQEEQKIKLINYTPIRGVKMCGYGDSTPEDVIKALAIKKEYTKPGLNAEVESYWMDEKDEIWTMIWVSHPDLRRDSENAIIIDNWRSIEDKDFVEKLRFWIAVKMSQKDEAYRALEDEKREYSYLDIMKRNWFCCNEYCLSLKCSRFYEEIRG